MKKIWDKLGNSVVTWVNNGGWITMCILGALGIIMALSGMIMRLINFWHEDKATFFAMMLVGLIVWGVAGFGIWVIVDIIKKHKKLFKIE